MDLHSVVSDVISAINPTIPAQLFKSSGYTTNPDGSRVPTYGLPVLGDIQVQALPSGDLRNLSFLNIGGVLRKVYLGGDWESVVRSTMRGGDKFVFSEGDITDGTWLVVNVLEAWPDWCAVAVQLQVNP